MTMRCIRTVLEQDIPVKILIIYNGTDTNLIRVNRFTADERGAIDYVRVLDKSVAWCWNLGLSHILGVNEEDHCLVINNDVELRSDSYSRLLASPGPFVTLVGNSNMDQVFPERTPGAPGLPPMSGERRPHPDFSCYLIRREAWEKVGMFDENFEGAYCEDSDYHCRLHMAGITAYCIDYPFYHVGSGTIKNVGDREAREIHERAERNREYFKEKWGFKVGSKEYYEFFKQTRGNADTGSGRGSSGTTTGT